MSGFAMEILIHDLRSPLSTMMLALQQLRRGELSAEQRRLVDIAMQGGDTLVAMTNDVLDVGKLESGQLPLSRRPLRPAALVSSALEQVAVPLGRKQLEVAVEAPDDLPELCGDGELLRRALVNLLRNAIKCTPSRGRIGVGARRAADDAGVTFTVRDSGPPIPQELMPLIFAPDQGAKPGERRAVPSAGMGLAFARAVVAAHGGRVWVESEAGPGNAFCFTLPCP